WELFLGDTTVPDSILMYDFDSGSSANDTFGIIASIHNLGLGNDEVMTAPGDSGGPTLFGEQIAGITSYSARHPDYGDIDSVPEPNSSFGEFGGDTRVSIFASWIDSLIDVPGAPRITDVLVDSTSWT